MAVKFVLLIITCAVIVLTNTQDLVSPCPGVFRYETHRNEKDKWYGVITLLSPESLDGVWLRLIFDNPSLQLGNWFGEVRTDDNISYLIKNRNHNLDANSPYALSVFVKYDSSKPVPRLIGIRLNAKTICPEGDQASTSTPFTNDKKETTSPPREPPVHPGSSASVLITDICGRPAKTKPKPLILYGEESAEGEWPWHVALYKNTQGTSKYICGGSLIAYDFIVTAAHCVADPYSGDSQSASKFSVYLGTASIKDFGTGVQIRTLSRIRVHPKYSRENYHNDIAILKTDKPVAITFYVKPICLWITDTNIRDVVGELGTVVGWGIDENNNPSDTLKRTKMPIVDPLECIYSKQEFFGKYTSMTSFCAGFRNGSSACNGDSGSGLVLSKTDANGVDTWFLRGIVSISVPQMGKDICDPNHYIVFTDAAKHVPWIRKTMDNI